MTASKSQLELANSFFVPKVEPGDMVIVPLNHEVLVVGSAESAAKAVVEGIQVGAEVSAGTVDGFPYDTPEILKAAHLATINDVNHRHAAGA
jgi:hypothetical protein